MKKILVSGKALLVDPFLRVDNIVEPFRPAVVFASSFINSKIAVGEVTLLSTLPDAATDSGWEKFYIDSDKDLELAKASFLASFEADDDVKSDASKIDAQLNSRTAAEKAEEEAKPLADEKAKPLADEEAKRIADQNKKQQGNK